MTPLISFIIESNKIEGINRHPTTEEIAEYNRFIDLPIIQVPDLEQFVSVYQPGAALRRAGQPNVRVGNYLCPSSGPDIETRLMDILEGMQDDAGSNQRRAWHIHCEYEGLHPFTDGNGRSGRMLWAWCMGHDAATSLGFLHRFYYQTLQYSRR